MAKPSSYVEWAETLAADAVTGQNNRVDPGAPKKLTGWNFNEKPPRQDINWLFWLIGQWVDWFDSLLDQAVLTTSDPTFNSVTTTVNAIVGGNVVVTGYVDSATFQKTSADLTIKTLTSGDIYIIPFGKAVIKGDLEIQNSGGTKIFGFGTASGNLYIHGSDTTNECTGTKLAKICTDAKNHIGERALYKDGLLYRYMGVAGTLLDWEITNFAASKFFARERCGLVTGNQSAKLIEMLNFKKVAGEDTINWSFSIVSGVATGTGTLIEIYVKAEDETVVASWTKTAAAQGGVDSNESGTFNISGVSTGEQLAVFVSIASDANEQTAGQDWGIYRPKFWLT